MLTLTLLAFLIGLRLLAICSRNSGKLAFWSSLSIAFLILSVVTWCRILDIDLLEAAWQHTPRRLASFALVYLLAPAAFLARDMLVLNRQIMPHLGLLIEIVIWLLWSIVVIIIGVLLQTI